MPKLKSVSELEELRRSVREHNARFTTTVALCGGPGCHACGSESLKRAFKRELSKRGLADRVRLRFSGCHGFCEQGPLVVLQPQGTLYCKVERRDVADIVEKTILAGQTLEHLLYEDPATGQNVEHEQDVPFYAAQDRILLPQNQLIDPTAIDDYIANGGYAALAKALTTMRPEEVIAEVEASGLRGRGGGGFPAGRKWEGCRRAPGQPKYVICNCDEGDPGAFMDRALLEGNPHSVLEGILIGAYAIGAEEGYIYVRHEYPRAWENAGIAVKQARRLGLLGKRILGADFSFDLHVARGGGAFVCGESTALMASLEGRIGEPRDKVHLHTVESGLWGKPTNLNNVETWANVPLIITKGADWYASIGTRESKGTKLFSLVGHVRNTGLVEIPMGASLQHIIYDIGGGPANGRELKAVQTGGPSGGCIPRRLFHLPVDFDELTAAGSMMGSGGMIVMDESTCMVDVARYFVEFLMGESCGKCLPCREGLKRMHEVLTDVVEGRGNGASLALLEDMSFVLTESSLCALGKTAANPVLSTMKYFPEEYQAHIRDRRCPAGVCRALIEYRIDAELCTGCGVCLHACAHDAIRGEKKQPHVIAADLCTKCGSCREACKFDAVVVC